MATKLPASRFWALIGLVAMFGVGWVIYAMSGLSGLAALIEAAR